jgi:hypothetical protein
MSMFGAWAVLLVAAGTQDVQPAAPKKELQRPADWVTRADSGGAAAAPLYFVSMPPGWHITTGPGTILYNPAQTCTARCRIEAEIYLFPGQAEGGYGVFLGGFKLEEETGANYDVFMLRWDGAHARGNWINGVRMPAAAFRPEMSPYVEKGLPDKPVKNVITIEVDEVNGEPVAQFFVNGHRMYLEHHHLPPPGRSPYLGTVGLRVDAGVNIHVTRLDVVEK